MGGSGACDRDADDPQDLCLCLDLSLIHISVDIVVTMGCNVQCPMLPCSHREDWGLDDPSGKEDGAFLAVMARIEEKVLDLKHRIETGKLG